MSDTVLYGISNCDTVKKARLWLAEHQIAYTFVDFKKTPPNAAQVSGWLAQVPQQTLLNRRGTTWRKLSAAEQAQADIPALMAAHPSLIKRPLLEHRGKVYCGFQAALYQDVFCP